MKWRKLGLVYAPDGRSPWARHSALQPTPCLRDDRTIRVYAGFRDDAGVGRVGYVDLDAEDPCRVLRVSPGPVLDVGIPGTFDENGVVPSAIVRRDGQWHLYYTGYQLGQKVRFYVFGGLAVSRDGESFTRHSPVPVLDRTPNELFFRVAHSVLWENGVWRVWYGAGSTWVPGEGKQLPVYDIRYAESPDGARFPAEGRVCVGVAGGDEHRVARPYVIKDGELYRMFYSVGTKSQLYRLGYAESADGVRWQRKDGELGLTVSDSGWDSQMVGYSSVVRYRDRVYLFYNGNDYGRGGFGCAVLEHW